MYLSHLLSRERKWRNSPIEPNVMSQANVACRKLATNAFVDLSLNVETIPSLPETRSSPTGKTINRATGKLTNHHRPSCPLVSSASQYIAPKKKKTA